MKISRNPLLVTSPKVESSFFPKIWFKQIYIDNIFPTKEDDRWIKHPDKNTNTILYIGTRCASQFLIYLFLMAGPFNFCPHNFKEDETIIQCMITIVHMALFSHGRLRYKKVECSSYEYYNKIIYHVCALFEFKTKTIDFTVERIKMSDDQEKIRNILTCELTTAFSEDYQLKCPWESVDRFVRKLETEWVSLPQLVFWDISS